MHASAPSPPASPISSPTYPALPLPIPSRRSRSLLGSHISERLIGRLPEARGLAWRRLIRGIYISSLIILTLLIIGCLTIAGYDIISQAAIERDYRRIIILGLSYFLMALFAGIIGIGRILWVRRARQAIPPTHIPIRPNEVPRRSLQAINANLSRSLSIMKEAQPEPKSADQPGWGKVGSAYEGTHLRPSFLATFPLLTRAVSGVCPLCALTPDMTAITPRSWVSRVLIHQEEEEERMGQARSPTHSLDPRCLLEWLRMWEEVRWIRDSQVTETMYVRGMKLTSLLLSR